MSTTTFPPMTAAVYTATTIGGAWTADAWAEVDALHLRLAPTISYAAVTRHYGRLARGGLTYDVAAVDWRGRFVKIVLTANGSTHTWYGYCAAQTDAIDASWTDSGGTTVHTGAQAFTVYGVEWLLTQYTIPYLWQFDETAGPTLGDALPNYGVPTLNRVGPGTNRRLLGNRSTLPCNVVGVYGLHNTNTAAAYRWSAATALAHLLKLVESVTGLTCTLAGQTSALAQHQQVWDFKGNTFWQALNEILAPEFGYAFYVTASDALALTLTVKSVTDTAVTDGGATTLIPAHDQQVAFNLHQTPGIASARVRLLDNAHYDQIVVEGAPLRVAFTLRDSLLQAGWTAADEAEYVASPGTRAKQNWSSVFQRFATTRALLRAASPCLIPSIDSATGGVNTSVPQPCLLRNWRVEPTLPWDRSQTVVGADVAPQPARLLALVKDGNDEYFPLDRPPVGSRIPSTGVAATDDAFGVDIHAAQQNLFALDENAPGPDGLPPLFRWQDLIFTVSCYTEDRVRFAGATLAPEPGPLTKIKTIRLPDAELWWVAPNTVMDVATSTTLTNHAGGYTRDDRWLLQKVLYFAQVWYGRNRAQVEIEYSFPGIFDRLGQMVKETSTGAATVPAGTVITQVDYSLQQQRVGFKTEWFDLDWSRYSAALRANRGALAAADGALALARHLSQWVRQPGMTDTPDSECFYHTGLQKLYFPAIQVPSGHTVNGYSSPVTGLTLTIPPGSDALVYIGRAALDGTAWTVQLGTGGLVQPQLLAYIKTSAAGRLQAFTRYTTAQRIAAQGHTQDVIVGGVGTLHFVNGVFTSLT